MRREMNWYRCMSKSIRTRLRFEPREWFHGNRSSRHTTVHAKKVIYKNIQLVEEVYSNESDSEEEQSCPNSQQKCNCKTRACTLLRCEPSNSAISGELKVYGRYSFSLYWWSDRTTIVLQETSEMYTCFLCPRNFEITIRFLPHWGKTREACTVPATARPFLLPNEQRLRRRFQRQSWGQDCLVCLRCHSLHTLIKGAHTTPTIQHARYCAEGEEAYSPCWSLHGPYRSYPS